MNTTIKQALLATLIATMFLAGCGDKKTVSGHGHDHDAHSAAEEGGHDHEIGAEKITSFSEHTELFVEFPPLIVGGNSAFAAHLTRLADFKPVAAGKVSVILSGGGQAEEVFSIDKPSQAGIFRPEAKPQHAGVRELAIEVATKEFTVRHALGAITVHADQKAAAAQARHEEEEDGIVFTKEQQWKVDFAIVEARPRPLRPIVAATGVLRGRPDGEAQLSAPVAGQVQTGKFPRLGQVVKKGDVLAYLAPRLGGDVDLASLQTGARKAAVELDLAKRERARMESLFKDEAVPEKRLLAARAAEVTAQAELDAAQQRLGQYGGAGGGVPLRAPVSGVIADVRIAPGGFAQEGQMLFHIVDRRALWLELRVPEVDAARLSTPSGAAFHVEGIEDSFTIDSGKNGKLIAVGGAIDPVTRTLPVVFEFTAPDARLRLGMAVKAQVFAGAPRETLAIPAASIVDEAGIATVFVMRHGEAFERRQVRLGAQAGDWVEVLEGLESGQRVVSRGAYLVKLAATKSGDIGHGHAH